MTDHRHPKAQDSHHRATISEVAAKAGVSRPTVSRVFTGSANVAPETRARIEAVIEELGYRPSEVARALSYGKTLTVGAVVPFLTHPSAVQRVRGLIDGLRSSSFPLTLYDVEEPSHRMDHFDVLTSTQPPSGTVVVSIHPTQNELEAFHATGNPVVFIDVDVPEFSTVTVDHSEGGRIATQHLIDLGHTAIGFIGDDELNPLGFTSSALHRSGYRDALISAGIPLDDAREATGTHGNVSAQALALEMLGSTDRPTGIVCASDTQAMGVLDAASDLGLDVPGELSVVGFDDIEASAYLGLTTVRQPLETSGCAAAEILIAAIKDPGLPVVHTRLPLDLVLRTTTGIPQTQS